MFEFGNVLKTDFSAWFMQGVYGATSESTDYDYDIAESIIEGFLRGEIAVRRENASSASAAISMVQAFEDAVSSTSSLLAQMEELADEAANGSYTEEEREDMQEELEGLGSELNDIVEATEYDNNKLLSADGKTISISIGNGSTIDIAPRDLIFDAESLDLTTDEGAVEALSVIQAAIEEAGDYGDYLNGQVERLGNVESLIEFSIEDTMGAGSMLERILTTQAALEAVNNIIQQMAVLLAVQANVTGDTALELLGSTD